MFKIFGAFLIILLTGKIIHCDERDEYALNNQKFSIRFYNEILNLPSIKGKNLIFSPYSIQTAGALLYGGASGKTSNEMETGFNLPSSDANIVGAAFKTEKETHLKESLFKIANKIYIAQGYSVAPKFQEIAINSFGSSVQNIDFGENSQAAKQINSWISDKTEGHIKDLVQSDILNSETKLVLVNAIHFKGEWQKKFEKHATRPGNFYSTPTEKIQIDKMHTETDFKSNIFQKLGVRAAEYPFKNSDVSMFFLMPDNIEKSLDDLEAKLPELILKHNIFQRIQNTDSSYSEFIVPKFKINYGLDIKKPLQNLQMPIAFGSRGSFDNLIIPSEPLTIGAALHQASIECDEQGAEAAAATVFVSRNRNYIFTTKSFEINQSFLYFIKGGNGVIYFMGRFTGK